MRQARRVRPLAAGAAIVCWDLDNTLVDSGSLLRRGRRLDDAIVEAEPMPNMLAFCAALREQLPEAAHVFLTARTKAMRPATLAWLERHGLDHDAGTVWCVPSAAAKPRVWRTLARLAPLVIVDDLTYDHEAEQPAVYHDLVESARQTATVYVGVEQIARVGTDTALVAGVVADTVRGLPPI